MTLCGLMNHTSPVKSTTDQRVSMKSACTGEDRIAPNAAARIVGIGFMTILSIRKNGASLPHRFQFRCNLEGYRKIRR
jgi:hypothetical protein